MSPHIENLRDILKRAESGDVLAARDALTHLAYLLSPPPNQFGVKEYGTIPEFVRDYLANALNQISASDDPQKAAAAALHLKGRGPRIWRHHEKLYAANLIKQLIDQGASVDEACVIVCREIQERQQAARSTTSSGSNVLLRILPLRGMAVSEGTLQTWYYECKEELEAKKPS